MEIKNVISIASILCFIVFILLGTNPKRNYLLFVVFAFPVIDLLATPMTAGGFKVFDIITYLILFFLMGKSSQTRQSTGYYSLLIFLLLGVVLLGALHSEFVKHSLISLVQLLSIFIYAALLLEECYRHPDFIHVLLKGLKTACLLSLGFLTIQLVVGVSFAIYELNPNVSAYDAIIRYPSFFQDPQKYGQFLAICSFLFLVEQKGRKRNLGTTGLLFCMVVAGLFLTGVRAAFTGMCAGLVVVFIFGQARYRIMGAVCIAAGVLVFVFFSDSFAMFNRGANVNETADLRYSYWKGAMKVFSKSPMLGIGVGNYQGYVSIHEQGQYWDYGPDRIEYVDHPESGYLKFLAEFGLFGFAIMALLLVSPLISGIRALVINNEPNNVLLFLIAAVISWMVAFTTVYSFGDLRIYLLIVTLLCFIILLSDIATKKPANDY